MPRLAQPGLDGFAIAYAIHRGTHVHNPGFPVSDKAHRLIKPASPLVARQNPEYCARIPAGSKQTLRLARHHSADAFSPETRNEIQGIDLTVGRTINPRITARPQGEEPDNAVALFGDMDDFRLAGDRFTKTFGTPDGVEVCQAIIRQQSPIGESPGIDVGLSNTRRVIGHRLTDFHRTVDGVQTGGLVKTLTPQTFRFQQISIKSVFCRNHKFK
jgi:hypothetical protein